MFTGIVEEVGRVIEIKKNNKQYQISVACQKVIEACKIGDSISTNGVCLTVTEIGKDFFKADIMPETVRTTNLSSLKKASRVNLERALLSSGRLDGHIVQGHIDGQGRIMKLLKIDDKLEYIISADEELLNFIVYKGSVALDGISLTVSATYDYGFKVSIIPTTIKDTALAFKKEGDYINIETDIIGRYIWKMLAKQMTNSKAAPSREKRRSINFESTISRDFLMENGF